MSTAEEFFSADEIAALKEAIIASELKTSGEIRIYIEELCAGDSVSRAVEVFHNLGLQNTKARNGILFYLAVKDRKFAVLGDEGIHKAVPEGFWDAVKEKMQIRFKDKRFTEGLIEGIGLAGEKLQAYFPHDHEDINELPDEIIFG